MISLKGAIQSYLRSLSSDRFLKFIIVYLDIENLIRLSINYDKNTIILIYVFSKST